jgi:micrococcal nuclease
MKNLLLLAGIILLTSLNVCNEYYADVEYVYDGDTVTCDVKVGLNIVKDDEKVRLYGIDAPELRGEERPQGLVSRDALRELIDGKKIRIQTHGRGKYGRLIGTLFLDTLNVNNWMVRNGYAEKAEY